MCLKTEFTIKVKYLGGGESNVHTEEVRRSASINKKRDWEDKVLF